MSVSSLSKCLIPNTRSRSSRRIELTKKNGCQLKIVFPQEITNLDSVKVLHPGIKQVTKIVSGVHQNPKYKLNTQCFVEFENSTSADRAFKILHDKKVEGGHLKVLHVKLFKELRNRSSSGSLTRTGHKTHSHELVIKHLPDNTQKEDIKAAFPDCSKIKMTLKRRQASFSVPTIKSVESYLARPIHTVKGATVELISKTHPPRMSKSHPRAKNPRRKVPRTEKMESESTETNEFMDVNSDCDTEMQDVSSTSISVEEIF